MTNLLNISRKDRPPNEKPSANDMNLRQHLGELRHRLMICLVAVAITTVVAVIVYEPILHFLIRPLCNVDASRTGSTGSLIARSGSTCNLYVTSPLDGLGLRVKIAVFGGLVMASPVILFQFWRFVSPGLESRERKYAVPFVALGHHHHHGGVCRGHAELGSLLHVGAGIAAGPLLFHLHRNWETLRPVSGSWRPAGPSIRIHTVLCEREGATSGPALRRVDTPHCPSDK